MYLEFTDVVHGTFRCVGTRISAGLEVLVRVSLGEVGTADQRDPPVSDSRLGEHLGA